MYNRRYDKIYLMLRQETAGYGLQQKTPWGSCVLEIKNKEARLHITAQGLRPRKTGWYSVYAIGEKDGKKTPFFCGRLPVSSGGQGQLKWDFHADNLDGLQAEDIFAVVVLAEEGKGKGLSAPLTAYFGEKKEWKTAFSEETMLKSAESLAQPCQAVLEKKEEKRESLPKEQRKAEEILPEQEERRGSVSEDHHTSFRGLLQKFRQEMNELTEMGILTEEENRRIQGISEPTACKKMEEKEEQEEQKEVDKTEETLPLEKEDQQMPDKESTAWVFAKHKEMYPFGAEEEWKCIMPEEVVSLEKGPLYWQRNLFFLAACHRYGHLIARKDKDGVLLGLPESFREEDRKRAAALGLVWFRPMEGETNFGYWIGKIQD